MHSELTGHMGENLMTVLQLHLEHGIRQRFDDRTFDLNDVFLSQPSFSFRMRVLLNHITQLGIGHPAGFLQAVCNFLTDGRL